MLVGSVPVEGGRAGADELAGGAPLAEAEPFEAEQHRAGEAVVDLGDLDVGGAEPGPAEQVVGEQAGVVAGVVVPEEMVADVEPGPGAGPVGAGGDHRGRVAQVAGPVEGGDQHRAGPVDLDRAVAGPERLHDVRLGAVLVEGEGRAPVGAVVGHRVLALRDRDRAEVVVVLAGLDQEPSGPHRAVHEVGVVADRVAVLGAEPGELHGADPGAAAAVHGPVDEDVVGLPGVDERRGEPDQLAGGLPAELARRGRGAAAGGRARSRPPGWAPSRA